MPSPTDFNLSPYYDDFTESKKFHRILFRPAFAVQARELTQSQTQLQNQIERVSDHIFDKGAMVIPGEIGYDLDYYAVKLTSLGFGNTLAQFTNGTILTGGTSGVTAEVVNTVATDGTDPDTLYVKYRDSGTSKTATSFSDGETLTGTNSDSISLSCVVDTTATGCAAEVQEGVYYINGFHVQVTNQTLILDKYTNTPSYRVGLTVTETFVTPNDDASLTDNAAGSSNANAPGAHRFKIDLTLAKKTLTSTEDSNFVELLRLSNGILQNRVRTTEYAVLEETFARRTYDESGDYTVRPFDIDVREHLKNAASSDPDIVRGIYTSANGGDETKLAVGISPGKAYVKGYEIEKLATSYVEVDKARDFDTQNAFQTRFDVGNFVNVTNIYGQPDTTFVSGETEAFKRINFYKEATSVRGTENVSSESSINTIGRAKSRGFEYVSGTASANIFASSGLTSAIYRHYMFDINMFTHLNITTNQGFTTGEQVTGGTSNATGTVESISTTESQTINSCTSASPGVATVSAGHNFKEGQQVTFAGTFQVDSAAVSSAVYTVRNPDATTFELYSSDGTTPVNITSFTSATATHGVVILSSVNGDFNAGETITGGTSSNTAVIQSDAVGLKGVTSFDFPQIKQIGMAGSPTYTADTALDATNGTNFTLTGSLDISSGSADVQGINTRFTEELVIGDSISFTNDSGNTETKIVEAIISNTSLTLSSVTAAASTKTVATRRRTLVQSPEKNVSIFKLPYQNIKTLKTTANSGLTDTSYSARRQTVINLSGGSETITAGTNEIFPSLDEGDYTVSVMSGSGSAITGDVLSLSGNNHEGNPIFTLGGSPIGKQLTLDFGSNYGSAKLKVMFTVNKSSTAANSKTKTLNEDQTTDVTTLAAVQKQGGISLGRADIYQLKSVSMATSFGAYSAVDAVDITSRYELDNGQRDNFYDIGRIKLKTGELTPTGSLRITFDYFTHGTGDYFDVDSYSGAVDYENIPSYTSDTTGEVYELRDSLDFRPRVGASSTINSGNQDRKFQTVDTALDTEASTVNVVKFESSVTTDHEYYLQRVDKIFLDKEGNFKVLKGASSLSPEIPGSLDNAMHLYTLFIPAFTLDIADVGIEAVDNRRYTMRDIGRLERRIENVEYYTQLSLLEASAQSLQIQDADGFDRFKNGFIVDNFTGHGIGDAGNLDYKVSMDYAKGEMRPTFHEDAIQLVERDDDGTAIVAADRTAANYAKTGDLITLPYTETTLIDQPYASKTVNVNPFGIFTWIGSIALTPTNDEWKETERAPELVINNDDGSWDTLVKQSGNPNLQSVELGTVWNEWQNHWTGVSTSNSTERFEQRGGHGWRVMQRDIQTTRRTGTRTRTGIRQVLVPKTVTQNIGDRIISVAFVPFIRSRTISFSATRLKPNTRVYPFFDSDDVSTYVTPTGGNAGDPVLTDSNGAVSGTFAIPDPKVDANPRWRTGQRVFRLTSSSTNDLTSAPDTAANAEYIARGIIETVQNTIISTRTAGVEFRATNETESVTQTSVQRGAARQVGYHDPLAETFMIDDEGGVFLTSIDVYFSSKDANVPVTLQVRNTVNGYPGQQILPFAEKTLNPSAVNISSDGTTATTFTFDSPVYVQENTEYAFVLMANSTDYNVYVARLGETALDSDRTISQQPYAGVFFKSQNGVTWTADQNEDIKFKIKRAEFENVTGTVTLTNDTLPSRTLATNPIRTAGDSTGILTISHPNHGMHGTNNYVTIAGVPSGTYNGIDADQINGTYSAIGNVTLDSYTLDPANNTDYSGSIAVATSAGDVGGSAVTATQNRTYDVLNLAGIQTMQLPGTDINYYIRPTTGKSIHGSESEFSLTSNANKLSVVNNDNIYFTAPNAVMSEINETESMSGAKSFWTILEFSTTNTKLSPVLDTQRMSAFVISNRLNNPTSGNTPNYVADTANVGTSTAAVYLTKSITLENASTSLDVRLSQNVRSSSNVKVYFRVSGPDEVRNIEDLNWVPFNGDGSEDTTVTPAEDDTTFKEYKYSASDIHDFTSFQIKIVLTGSVSSYPPIVKDMRAIALAV
jgi:hypothetical protein